MVTVLILLLTLGVTLPADANDKDKIVPKTLEELESEIGKLLKETKTPGAGIALVSRKRLIWTAGLGLADVAEGRKATGDTLFRIGSISKMFVSLAVLMLGEQGRLHLDDVVRDHVPEVGFRNPWEAVEPIRIVHLLEHTTGFDDLALPEYAHSDPNPIALADGLAFRPGSRVSRWRPGTRFSYCNSGPPVAARIVEKLSGVHFEDFVRERLLGPLRMETATYFLPEAGKARAATLYHPDGRTPYAYWNILMRPSGSINASAAEMANLVQLLLNRGQFDGGTLLQPASIERMERPTTTWAARAGLQAGYGPGNYTDLDGGFVYHGHDGGVQGGLASLRYLPAEGLGYVFFINSGSKEAFRSIESLIRNHLTREVAKPSAPAPAKLGTEAARALAGYYRPDNPRQEVSRFLLRLFGVVQVTAGQEGLTLSPLVGGRKTEWLPASDRLFREKGLEGRADAPIAGLALIDDPQEGRFLQTGGQTLRRAPGALVWLELSLAAVSVALMASAPLFALVWLPRKLFRRMRGVRHLRVRVVPLVSVLCLAGAVGLFTVSGDDMIPRFGHPTVWSLGLWSLGWAFAATAFLGMWLALCAPASEMNRWARSHALAVSLANATVALYLLYWGVIGFRTWV